jgi:hypothetical protein
MIDEIRKSINSNLYERTRSPLYGTLIISWAVWNWKLIYYVLTVGIGTPIFTRIDCIQSELTSNWTLYFGPILSTLIILSLFEFVANYAYWLHIYYKTWRVNKKIKTEGKQLLTYEQSLKLRNDIRLKEELYESLIQEKELKIKELSTLLSDTTKTNSTQKTEKQSISKAESLYSRLEEEKLLVKYKNLCADILNKNSLNSYDELVKYFVTLGLFDKGNPAGGDFYLYALTKDGKFIHDKLLFM